MDAHLPFRLVRLLRERGYDALHTSELPRGNATPDEEINALSLREGRVVVTKDGDFTRSLVIQGAPFWRRKPLWAAEMKPTRIAI